MLGDQLSLARFVQRAREILAEREMAEATTCEELVVPLLGILGWMPLLRERKYRLDDGSEPDYAVFVDPDDEKPAMVMLVTLVGARVPP